MNYWISILIMSICIPYANANDFCVGIQKKADIEQAYIDHSMSDYKVISKQRLYFHNAPDKKCKNKNLFLISGDHVTGYSMYNGFLSVAYFKKNGDSISGWLDISQLENTGLTNGPSSEEQMIFNLLPDVINRNKLSIANYNCLTFDLNSKDDNYYLINVSKSTNNSCINEKILPFTLLIKKHSLDVYTNQGRGNDEFRKIE